MMSQASRSTTRYIALDVHKRYVMVGAVNAEQQIILPPRKVSMDVFISWSQKHLCARDEVVMEASTNIWHLYDHLRPLVAQVCVANPYQVKLIAASVVKTDKRDTLTLARLLAARIVPTIWVPSSEVRELRSLIAHRQALTKQLTAAKNRLHAVLHRHALQAPNGGPFAEANREWWLTLAVSSVEHLQISHDWQILDQTAARLQTTDALLAQLSVSETWFADASLLIQMPGIAVRSAMTILSAIGDITRFDSAAKLVGYAGLGTRVHVSGHTYHTGGITKQGRPELRTTLITCAWRAIRYCAHWRNEFHRLAKRRGRHRAIVAVARKMLVVVWHILTHRGLDRYADAAAVQRAFTKWAYQHRCAHALGLSARQFVAQALNHIRPAQAERMTA